MGNSSLFAIIVITFTRATTQGLSVMSGCVSQHHFCGEIGNCPVTGRTQLDVSIYNEQRA